MADKRITELTNEKLTLGDGDYTIVDSNDGTYKYKLKRIVDSIPAPDTTLSIAGRAADAAKTGEEIADVKRDLTRINRSTITNYLVRSNSDLTQIKKSYSQDGSIGEYDDWNSSPFIDISFYESLQFAGSSFNSGGVTVNAISFFKEDKTYLSGVLVETTSSGSNLARCIKRPENAFYCVLTGNTSITPNPYLYGFIKNADNVNAISDKLSGANELLPEEILVDSFNFFNYRRLAYHSDGIIGFYDDFDSTEKIPIDAYEKIKYRATSFNASGIALNAVSYFDENGNYIGGIRTSASTFGTTMEGIADVPYNAKYCTIMANKTITDRPYLKGIRGLNNLVTNPSQFTELGVLYDENGNELTGYTGWNTTDYIECDSFDWLEFELSTFIWHIKVQSLIFFDSSKAYISGYLYHKTNSGASQTIKDCVAVPANAKYFKATIASSVTANPYVKGIKDRRIIVCIGDSLTAGDYGISAGGVHLQSYPYFMQKTIGTNYYVVNRGFPGESAKTIWDNNYLANTDFTNVDCVIIMLGTNGGYGSDPGQSMQTDVEPYENYNDYLDTAIGCYCKIIESIYAVNKVCQIIVCTSPFVDNSQGGYYPEWAASSLEAIPLIADRYNTIMVNVYKELGINHYNYASLMADDKVHGTEAMYSRLGTLIASQFMAVESFDYEETVS